MPANEQTWRNLKILHVVFAVVSILLLVSTVMMLTADHDRPWKKYARGFRDLETWTATARVQEQDSKAYEARGKELAEILAASRRLVDPAVVEQMLALVRTVPDDAEAATRAEADLASVKESMQAGADDAAAGKLFAARGDLLARLRDIAKRCGFVRTRWPAA